MNTIYDGTYTIGQTSATNFVAGPGIKIDEPSAGTVRIGNDETVLWEGNEYVSAGPFTLSENFYNFAGIKIFVGRGTDVRWPLANEFEITSSAKKDVCLHNMFADGNSLLYDCAMASLSANQLKVNSFLRKSFGNNSFTTYTNTPLSLTKIVGINRISGSNA